MPVIGINDLPVFTRRRKVDAVSPTAVVLAPVISVASLCRLPDRTEAAAKGPRAGEMVVLIMRILNEKGEELLGGAPPPGAAPRPVP